jgi:negative regulator of sigma E activity
MDHSPSNEKNPASRLRTVYFVIFAAAIAIPAKGRPAENPESRLERVLLKSILAQGKVNVRGRQVEFVPAGNAFSQTTKRVIRRNDGRSLSVCLDSSGKPQSVHMDDGMISRDFNPAAGVVTTAHSMPQIRSEHEAHRMARRILSSYKVTIVREDFIAGHKCFVLDLDPRDPMSHSVTVWIDKQTGVTLSREESGQRGASTLGLTMFTDVSFPAAISESEMTYSFPRSARRLPLSLSPRYKNVAALRPKAGFELYQPLSMPLGYEFESGEMVLFDGRPTACLRYSDGVAIVNVFQAQAHDLTPQMNPRIMFQDLPRGEAFASCQIGTTMCVVIGARTKEGVAMIARSLDTEDARRKMEALSRGFHVSFSTLAAIRNHGCGMDCIAAILEISAQTGRSLSSVMALHEQGWSWPRIARQLNANIRAVSDKVKPYQIR